MAGKFTGTSYSKTIDSLVQATKGALKNPYYVYTDKKPTKVTYYKQNREKTTLDPDSGLNYTHVGEQSPIKFNKIIDFYLYGIDKIPTNMDIGDFGLETEPVEGSCIILPNTINPTQGDFFSIDYIGEDILFKVNKVDTDTLNDGANIYQIEYKLELIGKKSEIESQVEKIYHFIVGNVGTDFNCTLEDSSFSLIKSLDGVIEQITEAYQIFFDPKVQNFVFRMNGFMMYDPYLIEFMIRNKIMSGGSSYIYVHHGCAVSKTFGYEYTRTPFYILENPGELKIRKFSNLGTATEITDINSLLTTRQEKYYQIAYNDPNKMISRFEILPTDVMDRLKTGELYDEMADVNLRVYNLMIAYFNSNYSYIEGNLIELIRQIDYAENKEFYYLIPINIFIIRQFMAYLMKK